MAPKVLLVDDEVNILTSCQRTLRKEDYEVVISPSPDEALQLITYNKFAVVVSDQQMPQMTGTFFLEKVKQASPDTIRIILTGHADIEAALDAINRGSVYRFLTKPWNDDEFRLTIRQAVSQYHLMAENVRLNNVTKKQNQELRDLTQHLEQRVYERTQEISGLMQQLEQSLLGTVQILAGLAEIHSLVIGSHSKRVAALAREIGIRMGMSGPELLELEIAAKLHDIGKILVPPDILEKSEADLTQEEKEILLAHAVKGAAMVRMVPNMGKTPLLIRHHHERVDGTGYPDGLKGKEIPLGSRIIKAVSAFDRALNIRSIFQSTTSNMALLMIQSKTPDDLDSKIVQVLTNCIEERRSDRGEEAEVCIKDLMVGMAISRDVRTAQGILLLQKNTLLEEQHLEKLYAFQETNPFADIIYVYRTTEELAQKPPPSAQTF
jgi:response regulator RpfG family c-di-GMP phosphodiesterase